MDKITATEIIMAASLLFCVIISSSFLFKNKTIESALNCKVKL